MLPIIISILLAFHVIVCLLLLLVVLMQRPRSEGLGAAFGGGMTDNLFGAQTANVLTRITVWLGGAFFVLTLVLAVLYSREAKQSSFLEKKVLGETPPAEEQPATPAPATGAGTPAAEVETAQPVGAPAPEATVAASEAVASPNPEAASAVERVAPAGGEMGSGPTSEETAAEGADAPPAMAEPTPATP